MKYPKLIMGADPELFVASKIQKRFVSALDVLNGQDKDNPIYTKSKEKFYADGLAVETTVKPAKTKKEFVESIKNCIKDAREILGDDFTISNKASYEFDADQFSHPQSRVLGCNEAYNAFSRCMVRPTPGVELSNLRSCGGHIHYSSKDSDKYKEEETLLDFENKEKFVKILNVVLGTALNVIDNDETSHRRRELYGKAGEFRPTSYGVEMRSPSNYWLGNKELVELVHDLSNFCYHVLMTGNCDKFMSQVEDARVVNAIDNFDKEDCYQILLDVKLSKSLITRINKLKNEKIEIENNWLEVA